MKAMIFAAGKGERMLPFTRDVPKPLLKINHKMLIEYHLEKLVQAGVNEVVINVAWMAEKIMQALGDGERYGLRIHYSKEPEPLETAGAICYAKKLLGHDTFLLVNADVFTDFNFAGLCNRPLNENCWARLMLVANPEHNPGGDYQLTANGLLENKAGTGKSFTFAGISLIKPQMVYDFPHARRKFPLRDVFTWAISQNKLEGFVYEGEWSDVGTPERLEYLRQQSLI